METVDIIQFVEDHDEFLITYYAKKYGEIITRRGTWTKPNIDTKCLPFVSVLGLVHVPRLVIISPCFLA